MIRRAPLRAWRGSARFCGGGQSCAIGRSLPLRLRREREHAGAMRGGYGNPSSPTKGGPSTRSCHPRWGWVVGRADAWTKLHGRGRAGWGPYKPPRRGGGVGGPGTPKDRPYGTRQSKRRRGSEDGGSSGSQGCPSWQRAGDPEMKRRSRATPQPSDYSSPTRSPRLGRTSARGMPAVADVERVAQLLP